MAAKDEAILIWSVVRRYLAENSTAAFKQFLHPLRMLTWVGFGDAAPQHRDHARFCGACGFMRCSVSASCQARDYRAPERASTFCHVPRRVEVSLARWATSDHATGCARDPGTG